MDFHVAVDSTFLQLWEDSGLSPVSNKSLLTLLNDFEDGAWRAEKFNNFVWDNIAETALSLRERKALAANPLTLLREAAQNLRLTDSEADVGRGSELAEVVLYGVMRHKYNALPVVPKIFYKQNSQDNAKGADSVHIVIASDGTFSLWFGEAKFYKSLEDAQLSRVIESVKNSLVTDKLKKENSIVTSLSDLDDLDIDVALKEQIKDALSPKHSIDSLKPRLHVPILLLHQCEVTASYSEFSPEYVAEIEVFHKERALAYFKKQITGLATVHKYSAIHFHLILFPVPNKQSLVDRFIENVEFFKG